MIGILIATRIAVQVIYMTETCRPRHPREIEIGTSSAVAAPALPIVTDDILLLGAHLHLISDPGGGVPAVAMDPMTG